MIYVVSYMFNVIPQFIDYSLGFSLLLKHKLDDLLFVCIIY